MLFGMGIVFAFLVILMWYMKIVPILSKLRKSKSSNINKQTHKKENGKIRLKVALNQISMDNEGQNLNKNQSVINEPIVAAIAASIYSHTGKKPKKLIITAPGQTPEHYNVWGVAGRQDQMIARDMAGQVGFQY